MVLVDLGIEGVGNGVLGFTYIQLNSDLYDASQLLLVANLIGAVHSTMIALLLQTIVVDRAFGYVQYIQYTYLEYQGKVP